MRKLSTRTHKGGFILRRHPFGMPHSVNPKIRPREPECFGLRVELAAPTAMLLVILAAASASYLPAVSRRCSDRRTELVVTGRLFSRLLPEECRISRLFYQRFPLPGWETD